MKLMVLILNKTDALEYLLEGLSAAGIGGATIIPSSGMAMTLSKMNSSFLSSSIRSVFSGEEDDNKTIISVIEDEQLELARRVVYNTVGDLSQPNTGIMFTIPLDFVEGRRKRRASIPTEESIKDNKGSKEENGKDKGSKGT
ncbi:MAG: hypothetical protein K6B18_08295 [Ruminococcus sp.]|nr:hypothetical protein [Ruminococcus sp.]